MTTKKATTTKKAAPKKTTTAKAANQKTATKKTATKKSAPKKKVTAKSVVTEEDIRVKAQEIYEARIKNNTPGDELGDWTEAKKSLGLKN